MAKAVFISSFMALACAAFSQSQSEYVRFYGKVLSQEDSSEVSASMTYEKLPYYDDMGVAKSTSAGDFEFFLGKGQKYAFSISRTGFLDNESQVTIRDDDDDGEMKQVFYLEPDPEEAEPELITLENLIFSRGSDQITQSSYEGLDELVNWLDGRPSMIIQLEGHTDFAGNADANMRLSQARVEAVKEYLVKNGIKKNRVLTKAFGGTQPLFTERTDEAKAKNRRVEVRVISR